MITLHDRQHFTAFNPIRLSGLQPDSMHPAEPTHYLQVTAALIPAQGQLFIAQRPLYKKFGLYWEFPGGKVEEGEPLESALSREIKEELSWDIEVGKLFHHVRHSQEGFHIDLYAFWCTLRGGTLRLREHVAYRWVTIEQLKHYRLTAADRLLIIPLEAVAPFPV